MNMIQKNISVGERKSRIQTGKGVEGDLPDLRCRDILDSALKPHLKKGHFYNGLDATVDEIAKYLESRANAPAVITPTLNNESSTISGIIVLICFGTLGLILVVYIRSKKKERNNFNDSIDYDFIPPPPKPMINPIDYTVPTIATYMPTSSYSSKTKIETKKSSSTSTRKSSSSSSYSSPSYSSPSYDYSSSSSSSSSYDSGSSFGGGDSSGGGASSDW